MTTVREITIETEQGSFNISTEPVESGYPGVDIDFKVKHSKEDVVSMPRVLFELGESRLELIVYIWDDAGNEDYSKRIIIPLKDYTGIDPISGPENPTEDQVTMVEARKLLETSKAVAPLLNKDELNRLSQIYLEAIERIEREENRNEAEVTE